VIRDAGDRAFKLSASQASAMRGSPSNNSVSHRRSRSLRRSPAGSGGAGAGTKFGRPAARWLLPRTSSRRRGWAWRASAAHRIERSIGAARGDCARMIRPREVTLPADRLASGLAGIDTTSMPAEARWAGCSGSARSCIDHSPRCARCRIGARGL